MPATGNFALGTISAAVIITSDRVLTGDRSDKVSPLCAEALRAIGITEVVTQVVGEGLDCVQTALQAALNQGHRLVMVFGGTGFGRNNYTPEAVRSVITVELPGIAEQIRAFGLRNTPLSGLSRGLVGLTGRDQDAALVLASPGSAGGARDTLEVVVPLLEPIFRQLAEPPAK